MRGFISLAYQNSIYNGVPKLVVATDDLRLVQNENNYYCYVTLSISIDYKVFCLSYKRSKLP